LLEFIRFCSSGRVYGAERWIQEGRAIQALAYKRPKKPAVLSPLRAAIRDHNPDLVLLLLCNGYRLDLLHPRGHVPQFRPDYLIRLANGTMLIVAVKGQDTDKDRAKRAYLAEWIGAVNAHGGFGMWRSGVVLAPSDLPTLLQEAQTATPAGRGPRWGECLRRLLWI
jgi:hypothetical protein